jgi:Uncharacterized protein conserved in bacteria
MDTFTHYFKWPVILTVLGVLLGGYVGWIYTGTMTGVLTYAFICAVLGVLEISLSFDNAIVNANKLKTMTPKWQHRFLTWGIIIAVFGMRVVFPIAIVSIAGRIDPVSAVVLAATQPETYAQIMDDAHLSIVAFGGAFLLMVGLGFFFDAEKDVHWIAFIENKIARVAGIVGVDTLITLAVIAGFTAYLPDEYKFTFLQSAVYGLITFIAVKMLGDLLDGGDDEEEETSTGKATTEMVAKGGLGAFLYLEMLDASFSFDGVIGAFAISQNLFIIAIGLGIGALYVRSMTIMLVEKGTLNQFRYLEHGAFYAILALAVIMFVQTIGHVPEVITGLLGAGLIGVALWSSINYNRKNPAPVERADSPNETTGMPGKTISDTL